MAATIAYTVCHLCDLAVRVGEFAQHRCDPYPAVDHQPREREVRCVMHGNPTWRWDALCPVCLVERGS